MKIRNGFVSNSSSSSFIIGIIKPDKVDIPLLIYNCRESEIEWDNPTEQIVRLRKEYATCVSNGWEDYAEQTNNAIKAIEQGMNECHSVVGVKSDNHERLLAYVLQTLVDSGAIKIIDGCLYQ